MSKKPNYNEANVNEPTEDLSNDTESLTESFLITQDSKVVELLESCIELYADIEEGDVIEISGDFISRLIEVTLQFAATYEDFPVDESFDFEEKVLELATNRGSDRVQ